MRISKVAAARLGFSGLAVLAATGAWAQAIDRTGTGGGALSTITAPNTRPDGVTMPPGRAGAAVAPRSGTKTERRTMRRDSRIQRSICVGCD